MTVREIIEKWLKDNGYDGLCHSDCECACEIKDLIPCGENFSECEPGHKGPCNCGEGHDFHIVPKKKEGEEDDRS